MASRKDIQSKLLTYVARNYSPLPVDFKSGNGAVIFDGSNNTYLDMMSAYSATSFGHRHPEILQAAAQEMFNTSVVSRAYMSSALADFAEKLSVHADVKLGADNAPARVLPANGGGEAVESALKLARKYSFDKNSEAEPVIIFAEENFHGRGIMATAGSTDPSYKKGFGPFPKGIEIVPFNDAEALTKLIEKINTTKTESGKTQRVAAFIVEPIQGEAGIKPAKDGYLRDVSKICAKHDVLFIADEIQSGMGRTGKLWATEHDGVKPDIRIIGKAIGGGVYPVSAVVARAEVMDCIKSGTHGSTFGGNAIASRLGYTALDLLTRDNYKLIDDVVKKGEYLRGKLHEMRERLNKNGFGHYIKEIRGRGLFVGIEVMHGDKQKTGHDIDPVHPKNSTTARTLCEIMLSNGVVSKETHDIVIRLAPPFIITEKQMDYAVNVIEKSIEQHSELLKAGKKFDVEYALDNQSPRTTPDAKPAKMFDNIGAKVSQLLHTLLG